MRRVQKLLRLLFLLLFAELRPAGNVLAEERGEQAWAGEILRLSGAKAGLVVLLNCREARPAAELARGGKFLVHGLVSGAAELRRARRAIQEKRLCGQVSVEQSSFRRLPYADNLVNLLIAERLPELSSKGLTVGEILRVVRPGGVVFLGARRGLSLRTHLLEAGIEDFETVRRNGIWAKVVKPRPAEMDEWPQYMHGSDRNPVSHDTLVGVPRSLRWIAGSEWPKGPAHAAGTYAVLSSNGRNFYLTADNVANLSVPGKKIQYYVVARDAFNGLFLWERPWRDSALLRTANTTYFKSAYRLRPLPIAAARDRLYVGGVQPEHLLVLDAASGKTLRDVDLNAPLLEIARHGERVIVRTEKQVCSVAPEKGRASWRRDVVAGEIVVGGGGVFFLEQKGPFEIVRLDLVTGEERWRAETASWAPPKSGKRGAYSPLRLRGYQDGVLVFMEGTGQCHAVSARDGKPLWHSPPRRAFRGKSVPFFIDGLVWLHRYADPKERARRGAPASLVFEGLDPLTGRAKKRLDDFVGYGGGCASAVATDRFILPPKNIRLFDMETGETHRFVGARGPCNLHMMPANGLWYALPQACRCVRTAIRGFMALSSERIQWPENGSRSSERLVKGPAFGELPSARRTPGSDWPTLRRDSARSGFSPARVPTDLKILWEVKLSQRPDGPLKEDLLLNQAYGDPLSSPVISGGTIFLALPNSHQLVALDERDGSMRWSFVAGGRVDSPPTVVDGFCLFGCKNGWLYCLRASDGELAWRFRVTPLDRRIVAFGQLESPWPTSGSVLVEKGVAYSSAGRSPAADGGIALCAVEIQSGRLLWEKRENNFWGMCHPVLVGDGDFAYMGPLGFDLKDGNRGDGRPHLRGGRVSGLLNGHWRRMPLSMHCAQYAWSCGGVSGHLLVFSEEKIFGYREIKGRGKGKINKGWARMPACELFCRERRFSRSQAPPLWTWAVPEPAQIEALLLTPDALFAAGTVDKDAPREGRLWALSTETGRPLDDFKLDVPPIFDGMAAAGGRLYISLQDGRLLCLGKGDPSRRGGD